MLAKEIPEDTLDDLRLLVSELVTNSVRHADLQSGDWIRIRVSAGLGRVRGEVCDPGRGFDPPSEPAELSESGWGMYLLDHLAHRWGVDRSAGTCVWFELDT